MKYRPEYDLKVIGENLKRLREEKQLSVKYVKEYLRLGSVQAIYKYESGKGYPQADTMLALMELYGADIKDIIHKHKENLSCVNEYIRAYYIDKINSCVSGLIVEINDDVKRKNRIEQYSNYINRINTRYIKAY